MKKVITESAKLFTLVACVFVMFSCGGDTCSTCTMEGAEDVEICQMDGDVGNVVYNAAVLAQETAGFTCNE